MSAHTPEPWSIRPHGNPEGLHGIVAPDYTKWFVAEDCKKADAARIVACVNACAGMIDPPLTIKTLLDNLVAADENIEELEAERDALQQRCEELVADLKKYGCHELTCKSYREIDKDCPDDWTHECDCGLDKAIAKQVQPCNTPTK